MDDQRPGILKNGERTDDTSNQREKGALTDTNESAQLYSDVGESVQQALGNEPPVETDQPDRTKSVRTDPDPAFQNEIKPLIPDDAFSSQPAPNTPPPIYECDAGPGQ